MQEVGQPQVSGNTANKVVVKINCWILSHKVLVYGVERLGDVIATAMGGRGGSAG